MLLLYLEILLNVKADHLDLAAWSLFKLVDDQVRVVFTEEFDDERDVETDRALQVALAVSCVEKVSSDVVVVNDLQPFRIVLFKRLAADVALYRVFELLSFLSTHAFHRSIRLGLFHNCRLPFNEYVQNFGERIFPDIDHRHCTVLSESWAKTGSCCAQFVMLGVSCLLCVTTERLEDKLEVRIDHERRHGAKLVV